MIPFRDRTTDIKSFKPNTDTIPQMNQHVEDSQRLRIELKHNLMKSQCLRTSMILMSQHLNLVMKDSPNSSNQKKQSKSKSENCQSSTRPISILSNRLIKKRHFQLIINDHFH